MKKFSVFAVAVLTLVSVSGVFANGSDRGMANNISDSLAVDTVVAQPAGEPSQEPAAPAAQQETVATDSVK